MEQRYFKVMRANYESPLYYDILGRSIGEVCKLIEEREFTYTLRTSYLHDIFVPRAWCEECDKDGKIIYKSKFEELMDELHEMDKAEDISKRYFMVINGYAGYFSPRNQSMLTKPCELLFEDDKSVELIVGSEEVWFPKSMVIECDINGEVLGELEEELDDEGRLRVTQKIPKEAKHIEDNYVFTNEEEWMNAPMGSYQEKLHDACVKSDDSKRVFSSGASRNSDEGKLDFEGFFSPLALEEYAKYMNSNRKMEDGSLRDSDNWQLGLPINQYMKSMWRHFFDTWKNHRGYPTKEEQVKNLCGVIFNSMGMLHEILKKNNG